MRPSFRSVRAAREGVAVAVEPQARSVRHPQQRARDAAAAFQLARIADLARNFDRVFPRGGETRGDVAGCSGRLAPRALRGAARPPLAASVRAAPPQRAQPARQDVAREARGDGPLRADRAAAAARVLRRGVPQRAKRRAGAARRERAPVQVVALLGERAELRALGALAAQRVQRQQRGGVGGVARRRGGAVGRAAGSRDEGQPGPGYGPVRGAAAAVAHSLLGLRKELPFLLRVALSVHVSLRRLHLSRSFLLVPT